ncbi:hypothetical protein CMI37_33110 [Candidatus Pacearchaeota archaeon]|nr:hypothetical protein [Candidatus Pacearchaeota archaeon]|tara:strand:+ start:1933 stop:2949 length:1017 start_codon:yes stop_codon:yes gene_type:complete
MKDHAKKYIEVSHGSQETEKQFNRLVSKMPALPKDPTEAAIKVKETLTEMGFAYDHSAFRAQDVLTQRRANCLGFPLLIGSIIDRFGFDPRYQLIVNPQDFVYDHERSLFEKLDQEMPYDSPGLATTNEDFPISRFVPLEHLVLDTNGKFLLETTSEKHEATDYESARAVSFNQALSCVHKDQAIDAAQKRDTKTAKELAEKGLRLWQDNRQIHHLLATIAHQEGDTKKLEQEARRFQEIGGDDSLFYLNNYLLTKNQTELKKALEIYPCYAQAIIAQAQEVSEQDPRESRFLHAIASQLFANSSILDLRDFYTLNHRELKRLFEERRIRQILEGFIK